MSCQFLHKSLIFEIIEQSMFLGVDCSWWRHQMETMSALLALCAGNPRGGHQCFPLTKSRDAELSLICAWINGWISNQKAGDLRRHLAHCDFTVMRDHYHKYPLRLDKLFTRFFNELQWSNTWVGTGLVMAAGVTWNILWIAIHRDGSHTIAKDMSKFRLRQSLFSTASNT